ncbi:MAG: hypothetical protein O2913_08465 [Chloroflexi bacterium]|nr:hypothetical protein [Chloroflexota bacterium]
MAINATYPAIVRSSNAVIRISDKMDQRIESQVTVVYASAELDSAGVWTDTDSDTLFDVSIWVKNVGASRLLSVDRTDVFFGKPGSYARIPYTADAGGTYPQWSFALENATEWTSAATIKITIHYSAALASDEYLVKLVVASGAYGEHYFSF